MRSRKMRKNSVSQSSPGCGAMPMRARLGGEQRGVRRSADRAPSPADRCRHMRENASATVRRCNGRRRVGADGRASAARRRRPPPGRRAAAPRIPPSGRGTTPRRDTIRASRIRGGASRRARRRDRHAPAARCAVDAAGQQLLHREFGRGVQIARPGAAVARVVQNGRKGLQMRFEPRARPATPASRPRHSRQRRRNRAPPAMTRPRAASLSRRAASRSGRHHGVVIARLRVAIFRRRNPLCPVFPGW